MGFNSFHVKNVTPEFTISNENEQQFVLVMYQHPSVINEPLDDEILTVRHWGG